MRSVLIVLVLAALSGCADLRYAYARREPRWPPSIICRPPIQAAIGYGELKDQRDYLSEADEVTVYGYRQGVHLHFRLREAPLSTLLDVSGGLPRFGGPEREHLGVVRAVCDFPGGEGYAFNFRDWRRRDALALLADLTGRAIIIGPDVNDTIDVEVSGCPPIAVLRLLADEGGVIILEDDAF